MSVKRFWIVAAVGALAALTASLGGSIAYGGVELRERCRPDQDRRDHAADGELRAMGHSGTCRDGACDQRDQQDGRREGTGAGAEAQPRRRRRPVHEHERGDRRLPAADPAGERRRDRGHHRQPDRACDVTAGRGGEGAAVPREVGEQRDPHAVVALHVPHLPALCRHGRSVGRAVRAASFDHERGRDDRRLRVGPVVQVVARGCGQGHPERQVQRPGRAGSDDQLHAVSARVRRRVVDRGDGPSAGRAAGPGAGGTAGPEGAGAGCRRAVVAHCEERCGDGIRPLQRLQVHEHDDQAVQGAREALPADVPAERVLRGRRARRLRVREDRRAGDPERRDEPAGDRCLRPPDDVQHPRVRVPAQMDGVG